MLCSATNSIAYSSFQILHYKNALVFIYFRLKNKKKMILKLKRIFLILYNHVFMFNLYGDSLIASESEIKIKYYILIN